MHREGFVQRARSRRGTTLALIVGSLTAIVSVVALAVDAGMIYDNRRRVQAAADAAALAAASDLYQNYPTNSGADTSGTGSASALATASANGYSNNGTLGSPVGGQSVVTVNIPPQSGPFASTAGYAEVIVTYYQPRGFSAIWDSTPVTVSGRAVAQGLWTTIGNGIILLDPTGQGSLDTSGNGNLTVNGSIVVDSDSGKAVIASGNAEIKAADFYIVGSPGTVVTGNGKLVGVIDSGVNPTPDPLAYLPEPSTSGLTVQSSSAYSKGGNYTVTLNPGVYTGGISFSGNGNVTLNSGIYYLNGGGFSVSGNVSLSGSGVMLYNAPGTGNGTISISGNGSITMSPPTSGLYQGISIFQDRTSTNSLSISGNGSMTMTGTFYAAMATFNISGNGGTNVIGSQYISYNLVTSGNGNINVEWSSGSTSHTRSITLVE
jgi:Flp pilus assembly protein TadG